MNLLHSILSPWSMGGNLSPRAVDNYTEETARLGRSAGMGWNQKRKKTEEKNK